MMAKHQISRNVSNLIAYCLRVGKHQNKLEQTRPRILFSNLCPPTKNLKALTASIKGANDMRKTDRVHHIIFAHPKSDAKKVLEVGESKLIQEAIQALKTKGINLDDAPFVVIAHQDKDNHIDYHLIAASTDLNGKPIKDSYIGSRAMKATNDISKKYGLALNNDKGKKKQKVEEVHVPIETDISTKIELADVQSIEVDTSNIVQSTSEGVTQNATTAKEQIEQGRAEEEKRRKKLEEFNEQCNIINLTREERKELWIGHDITFQGGRKVGEVTNDRDVTIRGNDEGDKIRLVAIVEGVVKGIMEWLNELKERIKKQQDDKARKQSQQETQEREWRRVRGIKR